MLMKQALFESSPVRQRGNARVTFVQVLLILCLLGGTARFYSADDDSGVASALRTVQAWFDDDDGVAGESGYSYQNLDLVGRISHVKDGDSLILDVGGQEVEIRLHGVDAPEWKQPHGEEAKRALKSLVLGRRVGVDAITIDSYDRTVGIVFLQQRNINLEMVQTGNAWWYRRYARDDSALQQAEAQAKVNHIGLWRQANPIPPWDWRRRQ